MGTRDTALPAAVAAASSGVMLHATPFVASAAAVHTVHTPEASAVCSASIAASRSGCAAR